MLDLNLPKKDGREVLAEIKSDESLKRVPVVVLTTSEEQTDVLQPYCHRANCYIVKPVDFDRKRLVFGRDFASDQLTRRSLIARLSARIQPLQFASGPSTTQR